jgi:hypothetical protein
VQLAVDDQQIGAFAVGGWRGRRRFCAVAQCESEAGERQRFQQKHRPRLQSHEA